MTRVSFFLARRLHSADQHAGHDADVVREHAPVNLCVEVRPRLPFAPENIKASLKVRYDGFDPASPFLEPRLYVHAAGHVLERTDDLVEHEVDEIPRSFASRWFSKEANPPSVVTSRGTTP